MKIVARFAFAVALLFTCGTALHADAPAVLPEPWKHQDINPSALAGQAEQTSGTFTLRGTMDLWGTADGSHFVHQPVIGDIELVARVVSFDNPGGIAHAKASLCIRESLAPGARQVSLCVTATDGTQFIYRDQTDGKSTRFYVDPQNPKNPPKEALPKATFPLWLKLVRHANTFTGYESLDGQKWIQTGQTTLTLSPATEAGFAASSHKPDTHATATFDHVTVNPPAPGEKP